MSKSLCSLVISKLHINSQLSRASDIFSQNSGKSMKSYKIHKNTQNTAKFGRNLIKYMSVQQF